MCPFCLTTLGLVVAGAASGGGLAVLALNVSRKKNPAEIVPNSNERRNQDDGDRFSELNSNVAR